MSMMSRTFCSLRFIELLGSSSGWGCRKACLLFRTSG